MTDLISLKKYKFSFHEILRRITKMQQQQPASAGAAHQPHPSYWHPQQPVNAVAERPDFTVHMVLSCFATLCCGCLFGIIAFIFASK